MSGMKSLDTECPEISRSLDLHADWPRHLHVICKWPICMCCLVPLQAPVLMRLL